MDILQLVRGDTPQIVLSIRDKSVRSQPPVDLSDASTVVRFKVRQVGETTVTEVLCTKLTGVVLADGSIDTAIPYDTAGRGGRCLANCAASVFPDAGKYEGEVEITFGATGRIGTVYQLFTINVRADL